MANELEEAIEWVVEQFASRRTYGVCQVSSALLVHRIGSGEVIEGFLIFDDCKQFIRHYWTRVNGMNIDIGMMIHDKLFSNNIRSCYLSIWPPTGKFVYISVRDPETLDELELAHKMYTKKPKDYWKLIGNQLGWVKRLIFKN